MAIRFYPVTPITKPPTVTPGYPSPPQWWPTGPDIYPPRQIVELAVVEKAINDKGFINFKVLALIKKPGATPPYGLIAIARPKDGNTEYAFTLNYDGKTYVVTNVVPTTSISYEYINGVINPPTPTPTPSPTTYPTPVP